MIQDTSIIDDLLDPDSLPDETKSVSIVQTHISIVFIADEFVYKIKKPVNLGFLDFTTLEKRHYYCKQEVLLNRRLSRGVYLDVLQIVHDGKSYKVGIGEGRTVEYAVKMKRLPDHMLMNSVFLRGDLNNDHCKKLANILSYFHATTRNSKEIDKFGSPEVVKVSTDENFEQTKKYIGITIRKSDFLDLRSWTDNFFKSKREIFLERIKEGKIRDCHGDLHMEHVCLIKDIPIIDCIEFNERFRYTDTLSDIAFLLMDLEYQGGGEFSQTMWNFYNRFRGEHDVDDLLKFYKVYRAYVRGKVNSFQLDDNNIEIDRKEVAMQASKKYFELARSYIE